MPHRGPACCRRSRARLHRHAHCAQVRRLDGSDCQTLARGKILAAKMILSAMATLDQVIQQIRFALANLSERNGQHEFEHLCLHFARHRICFNILPATGPVGGGGDQGKDFETFRTFIHSLGDEKFAAVGEGKKLAFACSLQEQVSTMGHWGLEPRHSTPNFEGLREYLRHRWRYWDLDVEHPPIFDSAVSVLPK